MAAGAALAVKRAGSRPLSKIYHGLLSSSCKHLVLVASEFTKLYLEKQGVANVEVTKPGIQIPSGELDDSTFQATLGSMHVPSSGFLVYSAGPLSVSNGQDIILQSFVSFCEKFPNTDAHLVISWYVLRM